MRRMILRIIACILLLGVCLACSKPVRLEQKGENEFKWVPQDFGFGDLRIEDWKVGKHFDTVISRGFTLTINLPALDTDDANILWKKRSIDSWFLRLNRIGATGAEQLTQIVVPYGAVKHGEFQKGRMNKISINIYYAAASISTRLSQLVCPALEHRKIIKGTSFKREPTTTSLKVMTIGSSDEFSPTGKTEFFSFGKLVLNGGVVLKGTYSAELAFYSTGEKKVKSGFLNLPDELIIEQEVEEDIPGCLPGDVPSYNPDDPKNSEKMDQFKFGR